MSSQAYTPGLKRKEIYMVEKIRRLPLPGDVLVKEGEVVTQDTVVARTSVPGEPHLLKVAYDLGVDAEELERFMLKKEGEQVKQNEPLAFYKAFFGLVKRQSLSPFNGTVERISNVTGQVIVREEPLPVEVKAYIPGSVVKVLPKEGVILQVLSAFVQGIFGIGGEEHGELMMIAKKPGDVLEAEQITSDCAGKVLVGGALITGEALKKAAKTGVKGIVVGGIEEKELIDFLGYEVGVAITGQEETGVTLNITEGFGKMRMSDRTFELLQKFEGMLTCINGATQIRAGVMRPEVIIPFNKVNDDQLTKLLKESKDYQEGLTSGTPIRIIREPYFGALGTVVRLPVELQRLESMSYVRVLEAELEDGRKVIVPRANVEIIEE